MISPMKNHIYPGDPINFQGFVVRLLEAIEPVSSVPPPCSCLRGRRSQNMHRAYKVRALQSQINSNPIGLWLGLPRFTYMYLVYDNMNQYEYIYIYTYIYIYKLYYTYIYGLFF